MQESLIGFDEVMITSRRDTEESVNTGSTCSATHRSVLQAVVENPKTPNTRLKIIKSAQGS